MRNDFMSNMTHELKTPVSTIQLGGIYALLNQISVARGQWKSGHLALSVESQRLTLLIDKVLRLSSSMIMSGYN